MNYILLSSSPERCRMIFCCFGEQGCMVRDPKGELDENIVDGLFVPKAVLVKISLLKNRLAKYIF